MQISHLCFADDLLVLYHGDVNSVKVVKEAMDKFSAISGLHPNIGKSIVFFGNVQDHVKQQILDILPFKIGTLPVSYLGVPLITKKLSFTDCKCLIDKVKSKVSNWKNRMLSYAGRLQLIVSILFSMHVYWASVFLLPKLVISDINKILKGFLWCQGKAKIAWKQVCKPKVEGGVGIKDLELWNETLMTKHLWNVASSKESLWVKWVNVVRLKGASVWEFTCDKSSSAGWKQIMALRDKMRAYVISKVGDGANTFLWHDKWWGPEPLSKYIPMDAIAQVGLDNSLKVKDIIQQGQWCWPDGWNNTYPIIQTMPMPSLNEGSKDKLLWYSSDGKSVNYSTNRAWKD